MESWKQVVAIKYEVDWRGWTMKQVRRTHGFSLWRFSFHVKAFDAPSSKVGHFFVLTITCGKILINNLKKTGVKLVDRCYMYRCSRET